MWSMNKGLHTSLFFGMRVIISYLWIYVIHVSIFISVDSLELELKHNCPNGTEVTLKDFIQIDQYQTLATERLVSVILWRFLCDV